MKPLTIALGTRPDHGFDEPLGLLSDCHRRIERFLGAMLGVTRQLRGETLDESSRTVLLQSIRYFNTSAPRHTADEEASLFPRLRASADPRAAQTLATLAALESDHREAEERHAAVDALVTRWIDRNRLSEEETEQLSVHLEALSALYARHIGIEDHELFPAAGEILSASEIEAVGREMAGRRGVPFLPPEPLRRR
ncbi:MAG: hemerythrin domain-containing protein [Bacteroidales bacterium]